MEPSVGPAPTDFCCSTAAKDRFLMIKKSHKFLERILPFAVFGALWYLLIRHLSIYWNLNPQYSYGWFAPVICAYLFFIRWFTRPSPGPAPSRGAQWVFWIAAFALLPTWVVEQPNPDWRLLSWLLTLEIVTLSLCAIYFVGLKVSSRIASRIFLTTRKIAFSDSSSSFLLCWTKGPRISSNFLSGQAAMPRDSVSPLVPPKSVASNILYSEPQRLTRQQFHQRAHAGPGDRSLYR